MFKIFPRDASELECCLPPQRSCAWSTGQLYAFALLLFAAAALALFVDLPIAQFIQQRPLPSDLRRLLKLAEVFGWGGTVPLIILTAAVLDHRGWRVVPGLAIGTIGAGVFAGLFKLLIARDRPTIANLNGYIGQTFVSWMPILQGLPTSRTDYQTQSFPSAHAATAVGLAIALATLYPRGRWLFAAFAALSALQRIETQAHFTSDVLAGAALGCFVAAAWQAGASTRTACGLRIDVSLLDSALDANSRPPSPASPSRLRVQRIG